MAKRKNGTGAVFLRGDGRWEAQYRLPGGKRKCMYGASRREVVHRLQETRWLLAHGLPVSARNLQLDEYLEYWLEANRDRVRPNTFDNLELNVGRLSRLLGRTPLVRLGAHQIQEAYGAARRSGLSEFAVLQMHRVLNRSLSQAFHWGLVSQNPAINQLTPRPRKREMSALTLEQLVRLIEFTKDHPYHALWVVFGTAGLRLGEALGLKWEDIDLVSGRLMVRRALQRHRGKGLVLVQLKTARSYRAVKLTQRAVEALRVHRARNEERRCKDEWWNPQDLVFTSELGGPLDRSRPLDMLGPLLRAAGLPSIRVHELRHTAATVMLVQGTHPKVVQEMLGHSTVMTTLDTYSHVSPTIHDDAVAKLDRLLDETARNTVGLDGNRAAPRQGLAREAGHAPGTGFVGGLARRSRAAFAALRAAPGRRRAEHPG